MASASERYRMVFNGEIYNHLELREQLGDVAWRGHSDTETLLACFDRWGVAAALPRTVGMFAFAVWDRVDRTLFLARDRLGEKPLYFGWHGNTLLFASELKAIRRHPAFAAEIDRGAVALFLRLGYVPAPYSIYRDIQKLTPGTFVALRADSRNARPTVYWSARLVAETGQREPFRGSEGEACDELQELLKQAVAGQMLADVPVGAFLSGGIDSSTIVALMQEQSSRRIKTFTIGFREPGYDEAVDARAVARHLGTDHTQLDVGAAEALEIVPKLPQLYDEPFADSSQIPTFLVSQLARTEVTVSLSGDGGDELFAGYNRYVWAARVWRVLRTVPRPLRAALSSALSALSPATWDGLFRIAAPALPHSWRHGQAGNKLRKLSDIVGVQAPHEIYLRLISQWQNPEEVLLDSVEPQTTIERDSYGGGITGLEARMMYLDAVTYLPDDILVKVDRAAMGVSLETRVPLLDHRVVEFAWRVPLSMKLRHGKGKWLLRQVLQRYVPTELFDRPKSGFAVPLDAWLRGPLQDWAESLLDDARLRREGYLRAPVVRGKWQRHLSGRESQASSIWNVLMFQSWLECAR